MMSTSPAPHLPTRPNDPKVPQGRGEAYTRLVNVSGHEAPHQNGAAATWQAIPAAAGQVIPLELGLEVRSLLAPEEIQLNYLRRAAEVLPQPFGAQLADILLVTDEENEVIPAHLRAFDDNALIIETTQPLAEGKHGKHFLILLPIAPQRLDALRATIQEIHSPTLFRFLCQDRRREVRRRLALVEPIQMRLIPIEVTNALVQQQIRLVRHMALPMQTDQSIEHSYLNDFLYNSTCTEPAAAMHHMEAYTPFLCGLYDISPGGLALIPPAQQQMDNLTNRLVFLQMALPSVACGITKVYFTLQLFGIIRGHSHNTNPRRVHVRFLHRLPEEMSAAFAHLERRYLQHQHPLE